MSLRLLSTNHESPGFSRGERQLPSGTIWQRIHCASRAANTGYPLAVKTPLLSYFTFSVKKRITIVAICARVVLPLGARIRPLPSAASMPPTTPEPQAHCIAGTAYSATVVASPKERMLVSSPTLHRSRSIQLYTLSRPANH